MHYSQAYRSQEPPRLPPVPGAMVFQEAGGPEGVLDVPERRQREYNTAAAADLYRIECAVCHGVGGAGDGPIVPYLTSVQSYHATEIADGAPYPAPPNLLDTRQRLDENAVFGIITNGIIVMPPFAALLSEEERWDIVRYIFDTENGLGS
jgi:mono/diheme cytochrome c family protein